MAKKKEHPCAECYCITCDRWFHHLGIARHRAWHRDRNESCTIEYSDGRVGKHWNWGKDKRDG